jgi:hypothetical protein
MSKYVPGCSANMSIENLSHWYDQAVDDDESKRIQTHVIECPACQQYLTTYHSTSHMLQADNPPDIQERIWRGIQQKQNSNKQYKRPIAFVATGAVMALVIVFAGIFVVFTRQHSGKITSTVGTQTAIPTVTSTPTLLPTVNIPQITNDPPASPWVQVSGSSNHFTEYVFPTTDIQTIYACGPSQQQGYVHFAQTHDQGKTWIDTSTAKGDPYCQIVLDPFNPTSMALHTLAAICNGTPCPNSTDRLYRSDNSGKTWSSISLPNGYTSIGGVTWTNNGLYAITGGDPSVMIVSGSTTTKFVTIGAINSITVGSFHQWFSTSTSLYFGFEDPDHATVGSLAQYVFRSDDSGTTWIDVSSQKLLESSFGGKRLIASGFRFSDDNGQTWQSYPPVESLEYSHFFTTPDGTTFIYTNNAVGGSSPVLYCLLPKSTTWKKIQTLNIAENNIGVSWVDWNTYGQPSAIYESWYVGNTSNVTLYRLDI